jgi:hypothetical protein
MALPEMFQRWRGRLRMARPPGTRLPRPRGVRLMVERLEDRSLLSTWSGGLPDLGGHGQAANQEDTTALRRTNGV